MRWGGGRSGPRARAPSRARSSPARARALPRPNPFPRHARASHVILPKELAKSLQPKRLLAEAEWRALGVQQSRGWAHYAIHRPEPHILLFRRELGTDPMTGKVRARRGGAPMRWREDLAPTHRPLPCTPFPHR